MHGILLLDKPIGISSNAALQQVKRLFKIKKAGHTGSLDPLATGMLPICIGEATKFSQFLLESDKFYHVSAKLGEKTTTGDAEGDVTATTSTENISIKEIQKVLLMFLGEIQQIPPMYSAIKYKGQPLYKLARKGIEIERAPRTVHIKKIELVSYVDDILVINVHCTKGTYIRTLVEDIGERLGCGAHVSGLRRSAVAPYQNAVMHTFDGLTKALQENASLRPYLLSVDSALEGLPIIKLDTSMTYYFRLGQPVMIPKTQYQGAIRVFADNGDFLGIGEQLEDGRVAPKRLVAR